MKEFFKKINIKYLVLQFVYLMVATLAIIVGTKSLEEIGRNSYVLGAFIALSSIPHLIIFVIQDGLKNKEKIPYAVLGLVGITLGIVFIHLQGYSLSMICLVWGIFDITRSSFEIADTVPELKNKKWIEIVSLAISTAEIVIAILLIINRFEGVKFHLIFMGISFALYFAKETINFMLERRHEK